MIAGSHTQTERMDLDMKILTARDMRLVEAAAVAAGLDYPRLMENAGSAAGRLIRSRYEVRGRKVSVLCGKGNNGGDGFVVARKLMEEGADVTIVLLCGKPGTSDAADMYARAVGMGAAQCNMETEPYVAMTAVREAELLVDAVYGIGFHGRLPDALRPVFRLANQSQAPVIALDVPSGFSADSGVYDEDTLRAAYTITFTAMKPGLLVHGASELTGPVEVAQIGIDPALLEQYAPSQTIVDWDMVQACFMPRALDSHKGTYGRLLTVCGSVGMAGAALLAMRAAQRSGVGLVTAAMPRSLYPIAAGQNLEAVYRLVPETPEGLVAAEARHLLREEMKQATAILCGCGLGQGASVTAVVEDVLAQASCPVVLDADGINAAAGHIHIGKTARVPVVVTPHPGEMARLAGCRVDEVQQNRVELARQFAEEQQVVVVLKGYQTVIAAPGRSVLLNTTGNPGMAAAGSGDVLAGIVASLMAQGMEPAQAAMCGVYLHGLAGDRAAARLSQHAMQPSDLTEELGGLFSKLEK